jgi:hypothetical protein
MVVIETDGRERVGFSLVGLHVGESRWQGCKRGEKVNLGCETEGRANYE